MPDYQMLIDTLYNTVKDNHTGTIASYIPQLAKADPNWFGIAIVTIDGDVYQAGDATHQFSVQSVSKAFTYGMALADNGRANVLKKVAVEPVGKTFNAIILDAASARPPNPMINAGAIAIGDLIKGENLAEKLNRLLAMFKTYIGHDVYLDGAVFASERLTGFRNRAIANLLKASHVIEGDVDQALEFYFQQCSLSVTALGLATMAATLANHGINPITRNRALQATYVRDVLSVMHSCGMYDSSGEWAYRVGIPAKSGVSGGIIGVVPNQFGVAVFSPPLDDKGHSVRGVQVLEALSEELCLHIFDGCDDA